MTSAQTGLLLIKMADYLKDRLETNVVREESARSVLWSITHMLHEGAKECLSVAVDNDE
jgi:hypothetical protein